MSRDAFFDVPSDDESDTKIPDSADDRTELNLLEKARQSNVRAVLDRRIAPRPPRCQHMRKRLRIFGTFVFGVVAITATITLLVFAVQHSQSAAVKSDGAIPETLLVTLERATMRLVKGTASARVMYDYRSRKWRSDFQQNAKFAHSILVDLSTCTQFVVHYTFATPRPPICQRIAIDADVCTARQEALAKGPQTSRLREIVVRGEILEQVTVDEQVTFTLRRRTAVPTAIHVVASNDTFDVTDYAGGAFADSDWADAVAMCNETTLEPTDWRAVLGRKCGREVDITMAQRAYQTSMCLEDGTKAGLPVLECGTSVGSLLGKPNCTTRASALMSWGQCAPCNAFQIPGLLSVISHPNIGFFAPIVDRRWMMME